MQPALSDESGPLTPRETVRERFERQSRERLERYQSQPPTEKETVYSDKVIARMLDAFDRVEQDKPVFHYGPRGTRTFKRQFEGDTAWMPEYQRAMLARIATERFEDPAIAKVTLP